MATRKINATKNYRLFGEDERNRPFDLKKHKKLLESMKKYGFLSCYPIICTRDAKGNLKVKDGQHRLAIAQMLNLTAFWVEEGTDFDVAVVNSTPKIWTLRDYAENYVKRGLKAYQDGLDFSDQYGIPLGLSFALLAGTTTFWTVQSEFTGGQFKVKDQHWAERVASVYAPTVALSKAVRSATFLFACMAACRVGSFDTDRFVRSAGLCREKLVPYGTRDAYLGMMEEIYNFHKGTKSMIPLKMSAITAMRERNPANGEKKKEQPTAMQSRARSTEAAKG